MPLLTAATFHQVSEFVIKNLETYFFKKGIDAALAAAEKDYKIELRKAINRSLDKYEAQYPVAGTATKFPFYHSQKIINALISLGVMDQDYDIQDLLTALESEPHIILPSQKNIEDFLSIFKAEVEAVKGLEKLAIKATYQDEIFAISRKLSTLTNSFENAFENYSADLELQWKNRLDSYVAMLKAFKPQTALSLLDKLLESFENSTKQPPQNLLAAIWLQRGLCLKILNQPDESRKAYVKAYQYDQQNQFAAEQAALAYYKLNEPVKAAALGDKLLERDEYNPVGWVVKCLLAPDGTLAQMIGQVPAIVKKDLSFRILLHNMINSERGEEKISQLYLAGITPDYRDFEAREITINNLGHQGYWINVLIHDYFTNLFLDFHNAHAVEKAELVNVLHDLLERMVTVLSDSEINDDQTNLKFLLAYTRYLQEGDGKHALEMKTWYERLRGKTTYFGLVCANVLQIAGFIAEAIEVLESLEPKGYECYQLLSFCYLKKDDADGYVRTVKDICVVSQTLSSAEATFFANHIVELKQFNRTAGFSVAEFTDGKTFERETDEQLIRHIAITLLDGENTESTAALLKLSEELTDEKALALIAVTLYFGGKNEEAVAVFRKYISDEFNKEGRDFYHYIQALHRTKKDSQELLRRLENWRLNATFDHRITRMELQAYSDLTNWEKVIEIGDFYLQQVPEDEAVLARYLYALFELDTAETRQKIGDLAEQLGKTQFRGAEQAGIIGQILVKTGHFAEGFEILYRFAIDPAAKDLRMIYFNMLSEYREEYEATWPPKEFDTVEAGHFVKYAINRETNYIELNEQNLKQEPFKQFPGCGKGGAFPVKRPLSGQEDMITIEKIMNKYLYLHQLILDEVSANPYSGIPMESMEIDPDDISSLERVLMKFMGDRGSQEQEIKAQLIEQYYDRQLSFSQIIVGAMQGKYLPGYFELARRLRGINTLSIIAFSAPAASRYLLDLSSLPLLYQMFNQHQVDFGAKFVLAKHHADHIKHLLTDARADNREQMSLLVTRDGVRPSIVTEEEKKNNLTYLEGLSAWIQANCELRLSGRILDFIRQASDDGLRRELVEYLVNTTVLLEEDPELVLISDDTTHYMLGMSATRIVSTEYFAKRHLPADAPALDEFITNQYRGYTVTLRQLNEQYANKLGGKHHRYELCLENLAITNNPYNITTGVLHIRWLVLNAVVNEQELKTAVNDVFNHMLKAVQLPGVKAFIRLVVNEQFKLLGSKLDLVLQCLDETILAAGL